MFKWVAKGTSSWLTVHDYNHKRMDIYIWRQRPLHCIFCCCCLFNPLLVSTYVVCERLSVMHEPAGVVEILVQILQNTVILKYSFRIPPLPKMKIVRDLGTFTFQFQNTPPPSPENENCQRSWHFDFSVSEYLIFVITKKAVAGYECVFQGKNLTHLCHVGCFFDFYVLIHGFILIAVTTRSCLRYGFVSSVPERNDYNIISAFCEELTFCGSWQLIHFHTDTSDFCFMWWFATLIIHLYVCIFNLVCKSVTYHVKGTTSTVNFTYYKLSKFIKTLSKYSRSCF